MMTIAVGDDDDDGLCVWIFYFLFVFVLGMFSRLKEDLEAAKKREQDSQRQTDGKKHPLLPSFPPSSLPRLPSCLSLLCS
jgi:hypothetical protein